MERPRKEAKEAMSVLRLSTLFEGFLDFFFVSAIAVEVNVGEMKGLGTCESLYL